jgi:hypothetical protein
MSTALSLSRNSISFLARARTTTKTVLPFNTRWTSWFGEHLVKQPWDQDGELA